MPQARQLPPEIERPPSILLVEDNDDDIDLTLRAMQKTRLLNDIVVAKDGEEAIDLVLGRGKYAGNSNGFPQLILLDIKLPGISGHDVLKAIRGDPRTKHIPVVMLTSSKLDEDVVRSYDEGANSYVRKPLKLADFMDAIQQLQMYWLVLNERPRA